MKALILCSLHALSDISRFEREACNRAFAMHGIPAILTPNDHRRALASTTMLDLLSHLPGSKGDRKALIDSYLEILNDNLWGASLHAHQSVFKTLLDPKEYGRKTGIVSEYPLLATNLVRSSALLNNASKLGALTVRSDLKVSQHVTAALAALVTSFGVVHNDIEVLVAHQRDFDVAQSIGMHPRFVEEMQPDVKVGKKQRQTRNRASKGAIYNRIPTPLPAKMSA